jgi:thymidylate synthase (FAD)
MNMETAPRLLKYLIKHKHWSPFEMVDMTVEIKTSRAIAAQILRHRSFSFQEFSQRYSSVTEIEPIELRKQAETNRQSSEEVIDEPVINNVVNYAVEHAVKTYESQENKLVWFCLLRLNHVCI